MRIATCIITYRRPRWLAACLESLSLARVVGAIEVTVVVVDNDPEGTSRGVVAGTLEGCRWPVVYEIEPQRGISYARNRAVRVALEHGADFLAFIDDDETAAPDWLAALIEVQQRYGADAVSGPVLPSYEPGVPQWAIRGGFFERPRHPTGTPLGATRTGNCLISSALVTGNAEPFDPAFALTGGGDTDFFRRAHQRGASIVWADSAIVYERVPTSRATVPWLLRRAYRGGASFAVSERKGHRRFPIRLFTGCARLAFGCLLLLPAFLLGKARAVRVLVIVCVGAGLMIGSFGMLYREYLVVHGE
jgi:GT2 family glycosyltransferase